MTCFFIQWYELKNFFVYHISWLEIFFTKEIKTQRKLIFQLNSEHKATRRLLSIYLILWKMKDIKHNSLSSGWQSRSIKL